MNKKYQDMNYKEFIKEVLKLELQPHQEQLLDMFVDLKAKAPCQCNNNIKDIFVQDKSSNLFKNGMEN